MSFHTALTFADKDDPHNPKVESITWHTNGNNQNGIDKGYGVGTCPTPHWYTFGNLIQGKTYWAVAEYKFEGIDHTHMTNNKTITIPAPKAPEPTPTGRAAHAQRAVLEPGYDTFYISWKTPHDYVDPKTIHIGKADGTGKIFLSDADIALCAKLKDAEPDCTQDQAWLHEYSITGAQMTAIKALVDEGNVFLYIGSDVGPRVEYIAN